MKRLVLVLACLLPWATWASAQEEGPNLRQSINYFMTFFNESSTQASTIKELQNKEKQDPNHPYTETFLYYTDLGDRIDRALGLALNLCDLYFIYYKATYCFAKDEKSYLLARIDNILSTLQQLIDRPFVVVTTSRDGAKAGMNDQEVVFLERVRKLRAFIKASLPAFQR